MQPARDALEDILFASNAIGFEMSCDPLTGALLGTLAASKPRRQFLEIGTGSGAAACWLLSAMDVESSLLTVENDEVVVELAVTKVCWSTGLIIATRLQD